MSSSSESSNSSNSNDKKNKDSLLIDWIKLSTNPNNKAIMINIKSKRCQNEGYMKQSSYNYKGYMKQLNYNYNQHEILNIIRIIHKKNVLNHIKKFIIWMI
jgi:hypothetical protein